MIEQVLAAGFILTTPILLAAIGGLVNRQAGIVNIALEGKMLVGAFVAVLVSSATGSWLVATVSAALTTSHHLRPYGRCERGGLRHGWCLRAS